jgi:hypothetical protein
MKIHYGGITASLQLSSFCVGGITSESTFTPACGLSGTKPLCGL